jgi:glutathione S-transferase
MATLIEKCAPFRVAGLAPGAHRAQPHLSRHPFGRVPVMEHDDFTLYETQAILRYLERILPSPPLIPQQTRDAARMDQVMGISDWYLIEWLGRMNERKCMQLTTWEVVAQLAKAG